MQDTLVVDEEFTESASATIQISAKLEELLTSYLEIMNTASAAGTIDGESADALRTYVDYAKRLQGVLGQIQMCYSVIAQMFVDRVDVADTYLY